MARNHIDGCLRVMNVLHEVAMSESDHTTQRCPLTSNAFFHFLRLLEGCGSTQNLGAGKFLVRIETWGEYVSLAHHRTETL